VVGVGKVNSCGGHLVELLTGSRDRVGQVDDIEDLGASEPGHLDSAHAAEARAWLQRSNGKGSSHHPLYWPEQLGWIDRRPGGGRHGWLAGASADGGAPVQPEPPRGWRARPRPRRRPPSPGRGHRRSRGTRRPVTPAGGSTVPGSRKSGCTSPRRRLAGGSGRRSPRAAFDERGRHQARLARELSPSTRVTSPEPGSPRRWLSSRISWTPPSVPPSRTGLTVGPPGEGQHGHDDGECGDHCGRHLEVGAYRSSCSCARGQRDTNITTYVEALGP
jgi:hypothetical protein